MNTWVREDDSGQYIPMGARGASEAVRLDLDHLPTSSPDKIVGQGTTGYRAKRTFSECPESAVKFKWIRFDDGSTRPPSEGAMSKVVKEKNIRGVVRVFSDQGLGNVDDLRDEPQFQSPHPLPIAARRTSLEWHCEQPLPGEESPIGLKADNNKESFAAHLSDITQPPQRSTGAPEAIPTNRQSDTVMRDRLPARTTAVGIRKRLLASGSDERCNQTLQRLVQEWNPSSRYLDMEHHDRGNHDERD